MASLRQRLSPYKGSPKDLARWAFWVPFRDMLKPERPEQIRKLYPLYKAQLMAGGAQKALIRDELTRCFGAGSDGTIEEAYRVAFQVHLEELLLGKLTPETVSNYMVWDGRQHLDAALERGKGALILLPHAGNIMMMIAKLSLSGYKYTQYAARGLAPKEVADSNPDVFGHNYWRETTRNTREANEDRLPANYLTLDTSARELYRRLAANETVGITYDGRIGTKFVQTPYLGRTALLSPGPYRMAASTGAAIVPIFNYCPPSGPNVAQVGEPIYGDDAKVLARTFIQERAEPWLKAHPDHYGIWLAHCRERAAVDDHPFFVDYAPDERWTKHKRSMW